MAWSDIPDFIDGDPVPAAQLNLLADNLTYIRKPSVQVATNLATLAFNNTAWASLGAAYEKIITTSGGHLMIWFTGSLRRFHTTATTGLHLGNLDFEVDGGRLGDATRGLYSIGNIRTSTNSQPYMSVTLIRVVPNLAAGSHTIKVMGKTSDAIGSLDFAAGGHLFIREV